MIPTNATPFQLILDSYQDECFYLYSVLKSLKNYPTIYHDDFTDDEGINYAASFALLCERFIYHTTKNQGNYTDEYEELLDEFALQISVARFEEELAKTKTIIVTDLKTLFPTEKLLLSFFGAIFQMETNREAYVGNYSDAQDFYHNYIL